MCERSEGSKHQHLLSKQFVWQEVLTESRRWCCAVLLRPEDKYPAVPQPRSGSHF